MSEYSKKIDNYREIINNGLKDIYPKGPLMLRDPIKHVLKGKGKRLRPILTLIVSELSSVPLQKVLPAALSIELLHNFTLIHDDIMDKDLLRHGLETIHNKWNQNTAILSGDAMLAVSMKLLSESDDRNNALILKTFIKGLLSVCEGQAFDIEFENNDIIFDDYMNMIYLKTAYMIGLSSQIGGMIADLSEEECHLLKEYGENIGMAYQVQDDILELYSDAKSMSKSLDSDIMLKKKTFVWASIQDEDNKIELNSIMSKYSEDKIKTIKDIRSFIDRLGINDKADTFINKNINSANDILDRLNGDVGLLKYFSRLILKREK